MSRSGRLLVVLAMTAMVALISGCGSSTPSTANQAGSSNSTVAKAGKAERFASCMRKNGVSQFPDPPASGNFTIDEVANGSGLNPNSPSFTQAIAACKGLEPAGFNGTKRTTQQQSAALKFAQCMRTNGVSDFPDPVSGQPLVDTNNIPSTNQPGGMSALRAAMQKCSSLSAAAGVHR